MSVTYDNTNRQVIPRCLSYATACTLGLLRINRKLQQGQNEVITDSIARHDWMEHRSISTAVDLVGEALIVKDLKSIEAIKAAQYIIKKAPKSSSLIQQLATHFLEKPGSVWTEPRKMPLVEANRVDIARLKKTVRIHPENPIAWSDLGLCYATLEQVDKAKAAMSVALNLSKNNRFILRSASRCFMHIGEPDRALAILNRSGLCVLDPWIASAEVAISEGAGLKSKCISKAKDLISDENITPLSRSELAVSIGTIEIKSGSVRKAKKVIHKALIDPTENALAQVEWASSVQKIDFDDMLVLRNTVPASYEATAVHAYYNKDFSESLKAAEMWGRFQLLSSRPLIISTFLLSAMLNDDLGAIRMFKDALPAQRESPLAINNYAFSLVRIGLVEEAKEALKSIDFARASAEEKLIITATRGMICFREGNIDEGLKLYSKSVEGFEQLRDLRSASIAIYYLAEEEKRIRYQNAEAIIREAKSRIKRYKVFEFEDLAKKL